MYLDEQNNVKAILPLMLKNEENNIVLLQVCDSCSDYYKVICSSKNLEELKCLLKNVLQNEKFDRFTISNLREDDDNTKMLIRAALENHIKVSISICEKNYYINTNGKYEDYFVKQSQNFRHKINHIRKNGQLFNFDIIEEYDSKILDKLVMIHRKKWKSDMQVSVFSDQRRIIFLKQICKEYAKKGYLRIFILKHNNDIIAYRLGFLYQNIYHDWNTSYDIEYKKLSVGILLCDYIVRYCFQKGIKAFDFLRGEEDYKKKFATNCRNLLKLDIYKMKKRESYAFLPPKIKIEQLMKDVKGFIFDLDGVVYSGSKPILSTIEFINFLLNKNIVVGFLTNTSSQFSNSIRHKLETLGVEQIMYHIETSSIATAEYMKENNIKSCTVYGGDQVLAEEIKKNGIKVLNINECDQHVEAVVIGYSKKFEYDILHKISEMIANGSKLIATDKDKMFAHNGKNLPGTAWILSSIETVNNTKAYVIGKPNSYSALDLLKRMQMSPNEIMIIGDNIESDIVMAKRIGSVSCLLLGGVSNEKDISKLNSSDKPDIIIDDLCKLKKYVKENDYEEKN